MKMQLGTQGRLLHSPSTLCGADPPVVREVMNDVWAFVESQLFRIRSSFTNEQTQCECHKGDPQCLPLRCERVREHDASVELHKLRSDAQQLRGVTLPGPSEQKSNKGADRRDDQLCALCRHRCALCKAECALRLPLSEWKAPGRHTVHVVSPIVWHRLWMWQLLLAACVGSIVAITASELLSLLKGNAAA